MRDLVRSRWAAIGAAVAVTLGAGGLITASAAATPSSLVPITPVRVLDTRLPAFGGAIRSGKPRDLDVTGTIDIVAPDGVTVSNAIVVPDGATAIVANVTLVGPTTPGFVSVRPGSATGKPTTSNLNATTAGVIAPNAVTVEIPTTGASAGVVDLWFQGTTAGATTDLLVDIVGYYLPGGAGPAGPPGPQGDPGPALPITDQQLAMLRWDLDPSVTQTFAVGDQPAPIVFDGTNIWVGNIGSDNFTKITPNGLTTTVPTVAGTQVPSSMAYTGSAIKVGYQSGNLGTLDHTGTGAPADVVFLPGPHTGIAWDGSSTWTTGNGQSVLNQRTGSNTNVEFNLSGAAACIGHSIVFDGSGLWVSCTTSGVVKRYTTSATLTSQVTVGANPQGMAYSGRYLWVANFGDDSVSRVDTQTGTATTFSVGNGPRAIAYDGSGVWVTNFFSHDVTHIREDGSQETVAVGSNPSGIVFDGRSVWVADSGSDTVTRLPVP